MSSKTRPVEVLKVFAFSSPEGGGNPAGVALDADGLSQEEMQKIAADVGLSETAFVSRSRAAGFRLDFFTPTRKIPDCGHATVAAFAVLKQRDPGLTNTSKEIDGGVRKILLEGSNVFMEQPVPTIGPLDDDASLYERLFRSPTGFKGGWIVRHDVGFAVFELDSVSTLAAIEPDFEAIRHYSEKHDLVGAYLFVRLARGPLAATTRMFAPAYGIPEESATGMAAGLLAALMSAPSQRLELTIEQGRHMNPPSPSLIFCRVRRDEDRVLVGGAARLA
ncbi:MAG: PhzF family phenazine biosynthesis protein [Deltaproteobacteria bacterium]|nr:PhzF family phenazine biosynthesis protein [Deltaproteobacteria bacterium]